MAAGADPGVTIRILVDTRVSLGRRFRILFVGLTLAFRALTQHFFSQSFPTPIRSYTFASACAFTTRTSVYHPPHCARLFCGLPLLAAVINPLAPVESRAAVRIAVGLLRRWRARQVVTDSA